MIISKTMDAAVAENFERYAGNVILDRAICDVRDMLKPGIRMLIYSQMYITKNTYKKPFVKSARVIGDCLGHLYEHGDSSCYGAYMRMAKPFAMRYPLEQCQGNYGTIAGEEEAAMRYTELRLNELSSYLYSGLTENAIGSDGWRSNFNETESYPKVMPSIGYFNICNGTTGLGIAISSSIPQFNLKEVNAAIIKLLHDAETPDEEIILMPDFATGATLINAKEVYESLRIGKGKACCLRAKMEYNPELHAIVVTEVPYGINTGLIKKIIEEKIENEENYGVENVNDNTGGDTPEMYIELKKGVNPKKMIQQLYKDTPLQSHFTINMWVLENGRFPKIMGLREIFMNYITHIRTCKTREIQFDLDKALVRKNIVDGLIKAYSIIDDVVATIRASSNPGEASTALQTKFGFNEEQAKAILAMKLSSLTKLDIVKLNDEATEIDRKIEWLQYLLNTPSALDEELIKILRHVAEKFGDERRTKILNVGSVEDNEEESVKETDISVMLFDNNVIRLVPKEEIPTGKRGNKGTNIKPPKNALLINTIYTTNLGGLSAFTTSGKMYSFALDELEYNKDYSIYEIINLQDKEKVSLLIDTTALDSYRYLVTVSKNGYLKKTDVSEYKVRARKGTNAVKLDDNDSLVNVFLSFADDDKLIVGANSGNCVYFSLAEVNPTGRNTKGVRAIKLAEKEFVTTATIIKTGMRYQGLLTIAKSGKGKITDLEEYSITARGGKGHAAMTIKNDELAAIYAIPEEQEQVYVTTAKKATLLDLNTIARQARNTTGSLIIDARNLDTEIKIM